MSYRVTLANNLESHHVFRIRWCQERDDRANDAGHPEEEGGEVHVVDLPDDEGPLVHLVALGRRVGKVHRHPRHAQHQARHEAPKGTLRVENKVVLASCPEV